MNAVSHFVIVAAMQKFSEAKQANDATTEKQDNTADTSEAKKDDQAQNNETSVDGRPTPAGESRDRGQDTVTPAASTTSRNPNLRPGWVIKLSDQILIKKVSSTFLFSFITVRKLWPC